MSEKNKQLIHEVNETYTKGDVEGFLSHCHENMIWNMIGVEPMKGKEEVRNAMNNPDYPTPPELTIEAIIAEDEMVVVTGIVKMKKVTGEKSTAAYCDVYRITAGKIMELSSYIINLS